MRAEQKAAFCISFNVQPSEYMTLTRREREAFWTVAKRAKRK